MICGTIIFILYFNLASAGVEGLPAEPSYLENLGHQIRK